ncbi:hypothetical protein [Ornithinimicrobium kibberense]|uniref:hypothetical protein n=1 Tax=Ornithinimicrobium kibberense TaxID=282060 RepID=UPI00361DDF36
MEVVAQGAAGTEMAAMVSGFDVAAFAVEVDGDRRAGGTDWRVVGSAQPWQQAALEARRAGAAGLNGVVVADVAEPAFWPVRCKSRDVSSTACARVVAQGRRSRAAARSGARGEACRLRVHSDPRITRRGCWPGGGARCGRARRRSVGERCRSSARVRPSPWW